MTTSVRADRREKNVTFVSKVVKSGVTVTKGVGVKRGTDDTTVDVCAAGDSVWGVAQETVVGDGTLTVNVALLCGGGVTAVKIVGTVSLGSWLEAGTTGFVARVPGGGTTVRYIAGQATQDGVTGDMVGMQLGGFATVSS